MKRILFLVCGLLFASSLFGQGLSKEEWNSIPAEVRVKIQQTFDAQARLLASLSKESGQGFKMMVEDGQYHYMVPANSIFTQTPRDRKAPKEGNYVFSRWCDMTDVNSAYIAPELFKMTQKLPEIEVRGRKLNLTRIIESFSGLYMLDFAQYRKGDPKVTYCRNTTSGGLRKDIRDFLDSKGYTTLMDMRENGQYTRLYMATDGQTVTGFVLVNLDDSFDYGRFICLEGRMPYNKFQAVIKQIMQ